MLGKTYEGEVCSAARALEVVGERWSLLIVRNAMFAGCVRFSDFQRRLRIAPNVLTKRLGDLVDAGVFDNRPSGGSRGEYVLTDKGWDLQPVIIALTAWGDRWAAAPEGRPVVYRHAGCGGEAAGGVGCKRCGEDLAPREVEADVADWVREVRGT